MISNHLLLRIMSLKNRQVGDQGSSHASVCVIEFSFMEKKARSRKESRRDQSTTITSLSSGIKSHVIYLVLFILLRFVILLFNSLHPSDQSSVQKSSAQPFVTEAVFDSISESEQSTSLASLASLKSITSVTSVIMAAMASAFKAAQDAAAVSADHPGAQDDVIMSSADPILIVSSQDQEALDAAHVRTEIAMSNLTISGHSSPDSLVKRAITASLPSPRMDMRHLSRGS